MELRDGMGGCSGRTTTGGAIGRRKILATTIPPSNNLESAIVRNLALGSYTAIVRGVNNTTGIAVVEAYNLD